MKRKDTDKLVKKKTLLENILNYKLEAKNELNSLYSYQPNLLCVFCQYRKNRIVDANADSDSDW